MLRLLQLFMVALLSSVLIACTTGVVPSPDSYILVDGFDNVHYEKSNAKPKVKALFIKQIRQFIDVNAPFGKGPSYYMEPEYYIGARESDRSVIFLWGKRVLLKYDYTGLVFSSGTTSRLIPYAFNDYQTGEARHWGILITNAQFGLGTRCAAKPEFNSKTGYFKIKACDAVIERPVSPVYYSHLIQNAGGLPQSTVRFSFHTKQERDQAASLILSTFRNIAYE